MMDQAEFTTLCNLLHSCVGIAVPDHDATNEDSFYSAIVDVCSSIQ